MSGNIIISEMFVVNVDNQNVDNPLLKSIQINGNKQSTVNDEYLIKLDAGSKIFIDTTVAFDTVKLSATDAYNFDINISDAIDVLRHIVDLETFTTNTTGYQAADVNNDDVINISDAIDILRHIVDLEAIDTFDVLDSNGVRVTQLDADTSVEAPTWMLVANGDVDMSGSFAADYVVQFGVELDHY